jgi:pilus assembly protein CpaB
MRLLFGLVLIIGIGLASFAVYLVRDYVNSYQVALAEERRNAPESVPLTEVYIAASPLTYGQQLTPDDVRAVKWPRNAIPEGSFTTDADATPLFPESGALRFVLRAMEKDEAILALKVTEPGESAGLASRLGAGMLAFTIKVDAASGVSGFLRPGDKVDVYWTGRAEIGGATREVTKLIEQALEVIAIDQTANGDNVEATVARTVTVAAKRPQVATLAQAQSTGDMTLALVGNDDVLETNPIAADQQSMLGLAPQVRETQVLEEKVCTIRQRKGAEMGEIPIPCTN